MAKKQEDPSLTTGAPSPEGIVVSAATYAADLRRVAEVSATVATGTDLPTILDRVVRAATQSLGDLRSNSILLLDEGGRLLRHAAAVGLPAAYIEAIDGLAIDPHAATCGVLPPDVGDNCRRLIRPIR